MRVEEVQEEVGHPEVEVVVALSVSRVITDTPVLSTFSCICYQKSVLLCILLLHLLQTCSRNHNIDYCFVFLMSENDNCL